ncbi:uncharacterized protein LOC127855914 [Dreissena polymorpha]|uniref:uncharacterized protein LOC127855914 n=1 Tax=Dreissena polymorpha TaxID=45954 RepID=UPI0022649E81|nr:uncharacterized protein LOC127855914 [Dreissena polymorpha]
MTTVAGKKKTSDISECPYGARCYRKNPQHFAEFLHPKKSKTSDDLDYSDVSVDGSSTPTATALPTTDSSTLPVCKYGAKCYRKNLMHFAEFSHPTAVVATINDKGDDTDEITDEDESIVKKDGVKSEDILKRGMSLVKSYSKMTEEERKELIKKAFEAKQKLQEELEATKKEVKKKEEEVSRLQKEVSGGLLLMEGEKEALEGKEVKYFDLYPERSYKEGSAAQTHFRLAESQFYRLLNTGMTKTNLVKVEYVLNPDLVHHFRECRESLKKKHGEEFSYPVLAFHGTMETNIKPICETGFKIPGHNGHAHRTDTGWYGKGVYFSEYPAYSMGYIQGSTQLLLCQVLPGKAYQCTKLIHGHSLMKGYDSHVSPCKKELVIFNKYHILPQYIVHYQPNAGEFKYTSPPKPISAAASTAEGKKGKGKKKGGKLTIDELTDTEMLKNKHDQAVAMPSSSTLDGFNIQFTGTFQNTQAGMTALVKSHGATIGTKAVFNLLIASKLEFDLSTNKILQANKKGVSIVGEMFLYDCIINHKKQNEDHYRLDD